jgi:ribosome-associated protein
VTASRVEAVFDVCESQTLSEEQKRRIMSRLGSVVRASAQDTRSQARNRDLAIDRLQERVENALKVKKPRRATKPSRSATEKRLKAKRVRGEQKAQRRKSFDD